MPDFKSPLSFDDIISGNCDPQGILNDLKPEMKKKSAPADSLARRQFEEINAFRERTGRPPLSTVRQISMKCSLERA